MQDEEILLRVSVGLSKKAFRATSSRVVLVARLAALALGGTLALPCVAAHAQDATWTGGVSGDVSDPANWVGGVVPIGMAYFGASGNTALSSSLPGGSLIMRGWTFAAGAPNYSYNVTLPAQLRLDGVGIVNNGNNIVTISNDYFLAFSRGASAANAIINNSGNGSVSFESGAMADRATINNLTSTSIVSFDNNSGLGTALINNSGTLGIGGSSAENAKIINNHIVQFYSTSTGGNATIQNVSGGVVNFEDFSTGGNAVIANNAGAVVDFSGSSGLSNDHKLSIGAITGGGNVYLGSNALSIGGTNQDSTLSGVFSDCGASGNDCQNAGATGGSLVKVGTGTLTIANTNTYTGGTTVSAGKLQIGNATTAGSIVGDVTVGSGARFSAVNGTLSAVGRIDNSGVTEFHNNTNPINALITNYAGGVVDFSGSTGPAGDGHLTAGAIAGVGDFYLGSNTLTLHGGFNATVSGVISDCGAGGAACNTPGATGGALVKSAGGTLTFTGANTYTGGTTVNAGLLALGNAAAKGSVVGGVTVGSGGILQLINTDLGAVTTIDNGGFSFFRNGTDARDITLNNSNYVAFGDASSAGNATITNNSSLFFFSGNSTAGNAAITNNLGGVIDLSASSGPNGDHKLSAGSIAGAGNFYLGSNALAVGGNNQSTTVSGTISDCGAGGNLCSISGSTGGMLIKAGTGDLTLSGANTYTGGTRVAAGTLSLTNNDALGTGAVMLDPNTTLHLAGVQIANTVNIWGDPNIAVTGANSLNSIAGTGDVNILGTSGNAAADVLTLNGPNAYAAATFVGDGTVGAAATLKGSSANALSANSTTTVMANSILDLNGFDQAIGGLAGAGTVSNGGANAATLTTNGNNSSTIFSGVIANGSGTTALTKIGTGTLALTGTNSYTGATNVNAGTLEVDGSIAASSNVTVNSGGTLSGIGVVDPAATTIVAGGTLAPGNPDGMLTITGNLAFQSAAFYRINVNPSSASFANVTGSATLGGATVNAVFSNTNYVNKLYSILTADGGVSGTFASSVVNTNLPAGFQTSLSYDATHAYLNVSLNLMPGSSSSNSGGGMSGNQQALGNAVMNAFNTNGGIPMAYGMLNAAGLTQASGELATASQQSTFDAMSQFMGLLTDPFAQRSGGAGSANGASAYADEGEGARAHTSSKRTDAFTMFAKAPLRAFEPRWSVWSAGFGGSQSTDGNTTVGSNDTTSHLFGMAVGADYLLSPRTLAGFALAGGGTGFSVNGLGTGRSDLFQAGAYLRHADGPAYLSAALAYGWQDIVTDRYVTIASVDHLRAEFNANAYSGRVEGGYRLVAPVMGGFGITPYAAGQFTTFDLPAYTEQVLSGARDFALAYGSRSVTDVRSELGIRSDKSFALSDGVLTLRGRFAWAHDYNPDRSIAATFQALPGTSFTVNGAAQASDSALTTASAEVRWMNGWSAAVTFDGAFSNVTRSYAGKAAVRYQW
ncbi:MAG: autotransporter domain-containing protein [Rhizobiales bacterium]|nr:autotransporter domain-containing protein [Hyphomicrobiales bacterium]